MSLSYRQTEIPKLRWFANQISLLDLKHPRIIDFGFGDAPNPFIRGDIIGVELGDVDLPPNYLAVKRWDLNDLPLPFGEGEFDVAILGDIIEHIRRPFDLIRDVERILRPDGYMLLSTPNPHYVHEIFKAWLMIDALDSSEHLTQFPFIYLRRYLRDCGFKIIRVRFFKFWVPFIKVFALSVSLPPPLGYQYLICAKKTAPRGS